MIGIILPPIPINAHYACIIQLYIKVSEDSSSQRPSDNTTESDLSFPEDVDSGSSGMELLDPHLPVLSKYWLAALKDKAYLFLPAEFANQLPPTGGMFYSVNIMDDVKQYYQSNWSSLLHAASIWLEKRGFKETKELQTGTSSLSLPKPLLPSASNSTPPALKPDPKMDNFHLILGLAVQSLCSSDTLDHPHLLSNCLKALKWILYSSVARDVLSSDARFSIEILSTLHRLLLTTRTLSAHIMALQVSEAVGGILQEASTVNLSITKSLNSDTTSGRSSPNSPLKDSDDKVLVLLENDLEPGKSCSYALLKVAACCLLRLVPSLKVSGSSTGGSLLSSDVNQLPKEEELVIILHSLKILVMASGLCAPEASVSILPSVLHLLLNTLGYISKLPTQTSNLVPSLSPTALQSLNKLCSSLSLSHDQAGPQLMEILQSGLFSILGGNVKTEQSDTKVEGTDLVDMSDETRLIVTAVFLHTSSSSSAICPPSSNLFEGCVSLFRHCLHSSDSKVCAIGSLC